MKILLKIWPVLLIMAIWIAFSYKFFIFGKVPFPSDYLVNNFAPWSAYEGFASPVKNAATPDVITQIFPWKDLVIDSWKSGNIPLWNPYSFSGTPLLANYQSAVFSPFNLIYFALPFIQAWSIQVLLAPLLAGLFTYLYLRSLKISQAGSVVSSLSFMFCGFITTWMDYGTLPYAIIYLPLALFSIERFFESKKWYFLIILALSIPLSFFSGHFQISIYFLLFVSAYVVFKYFQTKNLKLSSLTGLSVLSGLLLCAPQLVPSIEFYTLAARSSTFLKTEVIPWGYLPTFLAPDIFGNSVTRNDWFGHYAEWNIYAGLIPLMLAFFALKNRKAAVYFFSGAFLIAILMSFQTPLIDLLVYLQIPVLSTSAASRIIVLASFAISVLAGFGFDNLKEDIAKRRYKAVAVLFGAFAIIFLILAGVVFGRVLPPDKSAIALSNIKLPAAIFFAFLLAVFISPFINKKRVVLFISAVVILLVAFDMLRFVNKWMPFQDKALVYPDVPISTYFEKISGYDRTLGNLGGEAAMTYRIPSIEGYDPLYIERYGELITAAQDGLYHEPPRSVVIFPKRGEFAQKTADLLGVKYFVQKKADDRMEWAYPIWEYPVDNFGVTYEDEAYTVFQNNKVLPRAFVTGDYITQEGDRKILRGIFNEETDLKKTVFLEKNPQVSKSDATGSAVIQKYEPNRIEIKAEANKPAILVLTDPYYPDWKAVVNGEPTEVLRADYALRAITIPAGESLIEFSYEPESLRNGFILAFLGFVIIIGICFYSTKYMKHG